MDGKDLMQPIMALISLTINDCLLSFCWLSCMPITRLSSTTMKEELLELVMVEFFKIVFFQEL